MKTTTIKVNGETWEVPRGFGVEYMRVIADHNHWLARANPGRVIDQIQTALLLIGYDASRGTIADWPMRKRVEAFVYAMNVHLRASDNPIQRHPKLDWLPEPWGEPETGIGIQAGPGPTKLEAPHAG